MSAHEPKTPPGAVSGLVGRRGPVRDVEAQDAAPLLDTTENAPQRLIDPNLLTDELDEADLEGAPAAAAQSTRSRPSSAPPATQATAVPPPAPAAPSPPRPSTPPAAPAPPVSSGEPGGSELRRRRSRSAPPGSDAQAPAPPPAPVPPSPVPPAGDPWSEVGDQFDSVTGAREAITPEDEGDLGWALGDEEEAQTAEVPDEISVSGVFDDESWIDAPPDLAYPARADAAEADLPARSAAQPPARDHEEYFPEEAGRESDPPGFALSDYLARLAADEDEDPISGAPPIISTEQPSPRKRRGEAVDARPPAPPAGRDISPPREDAGPWAGQDLSEPEPVDGPGYPRDDSAASEGEEPAAKKSRRPGKGARAAALRRVRASRRGAQPTADVDASDFWDDTPGGPAPQPDGPEEQSMGVEGLRGLGGPPGDGAQESKLAVSASRGVFGGHPALSLISPNLTPHEDELNDALTAFSLLDPGMVGFIRVDFRAYPEFKGISRAYVQALRTGQNPEPQKSGGRLVFGSLIWVLKTLKYYANQDGSRGMPPPRAPWMRAPVVVLSAKDMTDETRQAIRDAERKSQAVSHYETMLSIGVVGPSSERAELERIRLSVESGFDVYSTPHQRLVWAERNGLDALIGFMPPDQERLLVLAADELAELARVPDALTRPQGVIIDRARIKPLPPTNPVVIKNPLDPDGGKIPLGVVNRGTDDEKVIGMRNSELDQHLFMAGRTGTGKSVAIDTMCPTRDGYKQMGDIEVGDFVFDEKGQQCRVTHAWPIRYDRPCYEIVFNDGTTIVADEDHNWLTETWAARKSASEAKGRDTRSAAPAPAWLAAVEALDPEGPPMTKAEVDALGVTKSAIHQMKYAGTLTPCGKTDVVLTRVYDGVEKISTRKADVYSRPELIAALRERALGPGRDQSHKRERASVKTTKEIIETLNATYDGRPNHSIDLAGAADYPEADLPIGSYTLGAFLGDGTSLCSTMTSMDPEVRENIAAEGHLTSDRAPSGGGCPQFGILGIRPALRALSLDTTGSKHIPDIYKFSSIEQRWALLEGLMDTDGSADKRGVLEYYSTKKRLAEDVLELVASLGLLGRIRSKRAMLNGQDYGETYTVSFSSPRPVFRIPRKRERQSTVGRITNRLIVDVRPVPSVPVRCIAVDSPSHLFLIGRSYVPTHNSVAMQWLVHGAIKANYPVVVVDPHGALGDDIVRNTILYAPERLEDLVIVDFSDEMWPVALNPLDITHKDQVEPTVGSVKEMLARQMSLSGDSAPRAVNFATQALSVMTEANLYTSDPDTKLTLLHVPRFFADSEFRQLLMNFCSNPSTRESFDPEQGLFEQLSDKQRIEYSAPIIRAFQPLSNSRSFANVFASGQNRLDFNRLVGEGKIIILKLSHFGGQGELASFVGSLSIPYLLQGMNSWGRTKDPDTGEYRGRGLRLFIDEAPTVCGPNSSAVTILAQARKWDLGLIAACQFPRQLDRSVEEEFYANTASKICLALDPQGVGGMARSLAGDSGLITSNDVVALPNYAAYQNILLSSEDGSKYTSGVFAVQTLPPMDVVAGRTEPFGEKEKKILEQVRERSRALICNPRDVIEAKRNRDVEDIRSALVQALADRAGDLPGAQRAAEPQKITALDLDDDDMIGGSDWLSELS
ncbi:LAGLIDADG family homing endonuclease [Miltoncostaea oceani]|uniref:LAGLIDADG family homing endonuclease n=1 Tax=Miltoncostaea oceani TaxID=2843216 RepID=UPI001C3E84ED|nr:LAGLIDADG family homing endonuclease [Miltoncostaea oceani]